MVQNELSLFFKANELPRTRSFFLPAGSSDNPIPTAPKARVIIRVCRGPGFAQPRPLAPATYEAPPPAGPTPRIT